MKKYSEKLKDPRWQKKRLKILERDDFTCQKCHDSESTLHVHHLRYFPEKDPWDYDDNILITLCEDCHEAEKEMRKDYEHDLLEILKEKRFLADDIYSLACGFLHLETTEFQGTISSAIEFTLSNDEAFQRMLDFHRKMIKGKKSNKD